MASPGPHLEEIAHLALEIGRILFQNNASTEEVQDAVSRFTRAFDCDAHLIVTYESMLLTLDSNHQFRTRVGNRVPSMNVNLAAVTSARELVARVEAGLRDLAEIRRLAESIEHSPPLYSRWVVMIALSLTAASLSRLFGGDWPTFFVAFVAGMAGTWLRQEMGARAMNPFLTAFVAALVSGIVGGLAVWLNFSDLPSLCLAAPGMIIVPGVPFVNGVQDMLKNHMSIGISRLGLAILITLAIAFGLFGATAITGADFPVNEPSHLPSLPEDALFSALAALGYLFLFNVPLRLAWVGILCGVASHTTRTFCLLHGIDIVTGSLIGAVVVGFLAQGFARSFRAPASAFAFAGVVAMIPGAFAFRSVIGYLQIVSAGASAAPTLVAETVALSVTVVLMVLVIALGVAAPSLLFPNRRPS